MPLWQSGHLRRRWDDAELCRPSRGVLKYLYYIGWNPQVSVSYRLSIGLAVSEDGGRTYRRFRPVRSWTATRTSRFSTPPRVSSERDRWRMWYVSCTGWEEVQGVRSRVSCEVCRIGGRDFLAANGYRLRRLRRDTQAIGRPWVVPPSDGYAMWFSYRSLDGYRTNRDASYRIGYAESFDGIHWQRSDNPVGLERSVDGWDSIMVAYANVIQVHGRQFCFYNGNGFGLSGIGYAIEMPASRALLEARPRADLEATCP